jgi:2-amino-4-hydroxy-6-hydroxymethyldihydropteridine diphosphokinase
VNGQRPFVGLGGNLLKSELAFLRAVEYFRGVSKGTVPSGLYKSAPRDREGQPDFLNAAVCLDIELEPRDLLGLLKSLEIDLGRDPEGERWGPRTIDLDILAVEGVCLDEPGLAIPHPRLHERRFALEPLAELAPDLRPWAACIGVARRDVTVTEALAGVMDQRVVRIAGAEWAEGPLPKD